MVRQIICINEEKCSGCGLCAEACHESAIAMVDGKAKLIRDDYCDGMGDCLPACPTGAITFETREAAEYDRNAVEANMEKKKQSKAPNHPVGGCPGSKILEMYRNDASVGNSAELSSQLCNWPVQIKLAPIKAPYFDSAKLLIAADCTAYAYANFHQEFIRGKVTLIGCPKLDNVNYGNKLTEILRNNDIKSVTVLRMEVPCCGGLELAARNALQESGKVIPWQVITISIDGKVLD